ncbi:hypothetical protein DM01DRAFT_1334707 [Hesseltinella vesiculosa]|uniref:DAGKc domain-containing protein n=1 Tax=Hesseltinella vesiculosa TaxID=101127 RepID=A0A1X2GKT5_9FUNG|nr:hypothetical protein DM01DRAFT_1334707 [Hesseltinella vesiculosa]
MAFQARYNNDLVNVTVDHNDVVLVIQSSDNDQYRQEFPIACICSAQWTDQLDSHTPSSRLSLCMYTSLTYPPDNDRSSETKASLQTYEFVVSFPDEGQAIASQQELTLKLPPFQNANDDTLIYAFVNPASGQQQGLSLWETVVAPVLKAGGFKTENMTLILTKAGKVREQAQSLAQNWLASPKEQKKLVLCMGGDGTVHDLINGMADTLENQPEKVDVQLGVVPAGSGNAFALSLASGKLLDAGDAALRIIRGQTRPFYLMDVGVGQANKNVAQRDGSHWVDEFQLGEDAQQHRRLLLVVMSWGFHAQIVSKSRYLRYVMGNKRFSLVAMLLLFFLHHYQGDLVLRQTQRYDHESQSFKPAGSEKDKHTVTLSSNDAEGGFTYFLTTKQASLEPGFNITPLASPFSHDMDVLCMRQATTDQLKQVAVQAFQGGKHLDHPSVDYFKAKELFLRVHEATDLCFDGEIVSVKSMDVIHLRLVDDAERKAKFYVFN